jgi:hypothetical protein
MSSPTDLLNVPASSLLWINELTRHPTTVESPYTDLACRPTSTILTERLRKALLK